MLRNTEQIANKTPRRTTLRQEVRHELKRHDMREAASKTSLKQNGLCLQKDCSGLLGFFWALYVLLSCFRHIPSHPRQQPLPLAYSLVCMVAHSPHKVQQTSAHLSGHLQDKKGITPYNTESNDDLSAM